MDPPKKDSRKRKFNPKTRVPNTGTRGTPYVSPLPRDSLK
jgi:hypothetical protein